MAKTRPPKNRKPTAGEGADSAKTAEYRAVHDRLDQIQKNQSAIQFLRQWREGDEQEQRETWEYLKKTLDEDRLSDRELFE